MSTLPKVLLALLLVGALSVGAAAYWFQNALEPVAPDQAGISQAYRVESGATLGRVAADLEAKGLIRDARVARWFAKAEEISSGLKVGDYELSTSQSTPEILETLVEGRVNTYPVVIPEGIRATEIADRLEAAGLVDREAFLEVVLDPGAPARFGVQGPNLEGYLFPDTYRFARGLPPGRIAQTMVSEFKEVFAELVPDPAKQALTMQEITTLASIVEKETGAAHERPLIAAVFLNRMRKGMRLETDPTVIYGVENFDGNLRRIHLEDKSNPYNTYRIRGLPPGPIASPGKEALHAVLAPADSPYIFFVSKNDGTHIFSTTYAEHEANVDRYQRRRRKK